MPKKSYWDRLEDWELRVEADAYLVFAARIDAVQRKWPGGFCRNGSVLIFMKQ